MTSGAEDERDGDRGRQVGDREADADQDQAHHHVVEVDLADPLRGDDADPAQPLAASPGGAPSPSRAGRRSPARSGRSGSPSPRLRARERRRPAGVKGRRRTSAQPAQRRSSSSATLPASCQVVQTRTVGPAPEIVAPRAPSSRGRVDQLHRARVEVAAAVLVDAVGEAARRPGRGRPAAGRGPAARRRRRWRRASASGISSGIASRARSVETSSAGITTIALEPVRAGRSARRSGRRPRLGAADRRSRRRSPRRRCRGGPRARSPGPASPPCESASSKRWSAANRPATIAAALEPRPRAERDLAAQAEGDAVGRVQALEGADDQVVAAGRHVERRPGRRRTRPSPRPRARGRARPPPPSRRSPGPRLAEEAGTRTRRRRAVIIEHRALDRAEVVLAVDHRRRFARAPCRGP